MPTVNTAVLKLTTVLLTKLCAFNVIALVPVLATVAIPELMLADMAVMPTIRPVVLLMVNMAFPAVLATPVTATEFAIPGFSARVIVLATADLIDKLAKILPAADEDNCADGKVKFRLMLLPLKSDRLLQDCNMVVPPVTALARL